MCAHTAGDTTSSRSRTGEGARKPLADSFHWFSPNIHLVYPVAGQTSERRAQPRCGDLTRHPNLTVVPPSCRPSFMFAGASVEDVSRRCRLARVGEELLEWIGSIDSTDDSNDGAAAGGAAAQTGAEDGRRQPPAHVKPVEGHRRDEYSDFTVPVAPDGQPNGQPTPVLK